MNGSFFVARPPNTKNHETTKNTKKDQFKRDVLENSQKNQRRQPLFWSLSFFRVFRVFRGLSDFRPVGGLMVVLIFIFQFVAS